MVQKEAPKPNILQYVTVEIALFVISRLIRCSCILDELI